MIRLITLCSFLFPAAALAEAKAPESFLSESGRWNEVYIAGQPAPADLVAAREAGVTVVINTRGPAELDWDESAAAEQAGLIYHNVPLSRGGNDAQAYARISELIAAHEGQKVLVHCGSGNRAAGWLATHLVEHDGQKVSDALATARGAGLTSDALAKRVQTYLEAEADD
ncbi:MAG: sulfur transferase domain-containing protein [Pseudomonadota bacterium]